ncbi:MULTISPECIES: hypothetical protein [Bacillus cereus group]|nr:hypothetical protein [Bacillus thuringiensis]
MNFSIQDKLQPFAEELKRSITPVFLEELANLKEVLGQNILTIILF